jgi:DNA-binding CsgD family transcriptional regulator
MTRGCPEWNKAYDDGWREHAEAQARNVNCLLTPRQCQILQLWATGLPKKEIARRLSISRWTVNTHVQRIYKRLGVHSRLEASRRLYGQDEGD